MSKEPTVAPEAMTIAVAADGNLLVSLSHAWSAEESVSFSIKVPKADYSVMQLRDLACQRAAKLLAGKAPNS